MTFARRLLTIVLFSGGFAFIAGQTLANGDGRVSVDIKVGEFCGQWIIMPENSRNVPQYGKNCSTAGDFRTRPDSNILSKHYVQSCNVRLVPGLYAFQIQASHEGKPLFRVDNTGKVETLPPDAVNTVSFPHHKKGGMASGGQGVFELHTINTNVKVGDDSIKWGYEYLSKQCIEGCIDTEKDKNSCQQERRSTIPKGSTWLLTFPGVSSRVISTRYGYFKPEKPSVVRYGKEIVKFKDDGLPSDYKEERALFVNNAMVTVIPNIKNNGGEWGISNVIGWTSAVYKEEPEKNYTIDMTSGSTSAAFVPDSQHTFTLRVPVVDGACYQSENRPVQTERISDGFVYLSRSLYLSDACTIRPRGLHFTYGMQRNDKGICEIEDSKQTYRFKVFTLCQGH